MVIFCGGEIDAPLPSPRRCAEVLQLPLPVAGGLVDDDADLEFYVQEVCSHKRDFNEVPPLLSPFHLQPASHMTQTPVNTQYPCPGAWRSLSTEVFCFCFFLCGGNISPSALEPSGCM